MPIDTTRLKAALTDYRNAIPSVFPQFKAIYGGSGPRDGGMPLGVSEATVQAVLAEAAAALDLSHKSCEAELIAACKEICNGN